MKDFKIDIKHFARVLGSLGGRANARKYTPEERSKRCSDTVKAFWSKLSPSERSEVIKKRWEKRRKNQEL